MKSLGCDRPIDYHTERFDEINFEVMGIPPISIVLDLMGGDYEVRSLSLLSRSDNGMYLHVMNSGWQTYFENSRYKSMWPMVWIGMIGIGLSLDLLGVHPSGDYCFTIVEPSGIDLSFIGKLLKNGSCKAIIDSVLPFSAENMRLGHDKNQNGHCRGKIVLKMNSNHEKEDRLVIHRSVTASSSVTEKKDQIIIYGHPASRAARNIWMLNELNVSYKNVITPFFSKKYDAMNPNRKVPFIQFVGTDGTGDDDDTEKKTIIMYESMAINLYLVQHFSSSSSSSILPRSQQEWSQLYKWSLWSMTELDMLLFEGLMYSTRIGHVLSQPHNYAGYFDRIKSTERYERLLRELQFPLKILNNVLQHNNGWMDGTSFSVIDLNVGSVAYWILLQQEPKRILKDIPFVAVWLNKLKQRDHFPLNVIATKKSIVKDMWKGEMIQQNAQQRNERAGKTSLSKM